MTCRYCESWCPKAAGTALVRWGLGLLLLFLGLGKFYYQGAWGFENLRWFVTGFLLKDKFHDSYLPHILLTVYGYCLPFMEMLLGALLLTGLARNPVLLASGVLMLSLLFGSIMMKDYVVIYENMFYLFLIAVLLFLSDHDRWRLPCPCKPKGPGG